MPLKSLTIVGFSTTTGPFVSMQATQTLSRSESIHSSNSTCNLCLTCFLLVWERLLSGLAGFREVVKSRLRDQRQSAGIGTTVLVAVATTVIAASSASPSNTDSINARNTHLHPQKKRARSPEESLVSEVANKRARVPKWTRGFVWEGDEPNINPSAEASLTAKPFPSVPIHERKNLPALHTILKHRHLFKIVTPINVTRFEEHLADHPNRALVDSACRGLREGFWPYAHTESLTEEITEVENHPLDEEKLQFLEHQRDVEMGLGRFSPPFDSLLPGMHTTALGAVPKPHSEKLRLITDQSKGAFALNQFIKHDEIAVRYDNLHDLGRSLRAYRREEQNARLVLWKTDISQAFRRIPMHPLWQIKQIIKIANHFHVDRCMVFGNSASPHIWCLLAALVAWIAIKRLQLRTLHHYMDDYWSIALFGETLSIIGFLVDVNAMTFTMDKDAPSGKSPPLTRLLEQTRGFYHIRHPVRTWQRILGWANWALNVFPLAKPALHSSYSKIAGKSPAARPYINASVKHDLSWFLNIINSSDGIYLASADIWDEKDADAVVFCDACLTGLGFWSPTTKDAFYMRFPIGTNLFSDIYWNETFAVTCAFQYIADSFPPAQVLRPLHALAHTDSMDTVELFSSLRPQPKFVAMILDIMSHFQLRHISHRVFHIAGERNVIADLLSRGLLDEVRRKRPDLKIHSVSPDISHITSLQRPRKGSSF
ncbi:hypothetical protein BD410DRAFT_834608 [Rickenella mellea]|uniref:Reverse transcriptase domain-containing protein n=1 Tax=Rickenella mellea TaxID=50990 RepID=A0A4Y7QMQ3_9AGAM|nr:hypothetical protein BD410DRAFT_834608 [Rickenella mellea]